MRYGLIPACTILPSNKARQNSDVVCFSFSILRNLKQTATLPYRSSVVVVFNLKVFYFSFSHETGFSFSYSAFENLALVLL